MIFLENQMQLLTYYCFIGTEMPLKALQTITVMAEGHAKLSLRYEVTVYDALAAIKLYEENLTVFSGYSLLIQNEEFVVNDSYEEMMLRFWNKLTQFLDQYVGDLSISINEE